MILRADAFELVVAELRQAQRNPALWPSSLAAAMVGLASAATTALERMRARDPAIQLFTGALVHAGVCVLMHMAIETDRRKRAETTETKPPGETTQ